MNRGRRIAVVGSAVVVVLIVVGVVVLVVALAWINRPPDVPGDFVAPSRLPPATTPVPEGALYFNSDRTGSFELYRSAEPGGPAEQLTDDPDWDAWWPRLSPDRRRVLFYRTPAGVHDTDFSRTHLWLMDADGRNLVELRPPGLDGWAQQGHAEWAPSGDRLVMFGGLRTNPQIFVTDVLGRDPVAVTARGGTNIDPSFSPDGTTIAFVGCPASVCTPEDYEIYLVDADAEAATDATRLTDDDHRDHDPYFSPDGTRLAWLRQTSAEGAHPGGAWNIMTADADGADQRRLTDDDQVNSKPEWSRDGKTIFFHRWQRGRRGFSIFAVDADGGPIREITASQPGINEFPST